MIIYELAKIILNCKHRKISRMKIEDANKTSSKKLLTTVLV